MQKRLIYIALLGLLSASIALGEEEETQQSILSSEQVRDASRLLLAPNVVDVASDSPTTTPHSGFVFQATREQKQIEAHVGYDTGKYNLSVKISGPIDESAVSADLADLNGLANSVVADFGVTRTIWNPKPSEKKTQRTCDRYKQTLTLGERRGGDHKIRDIEINDWTAFLVRLKKAKKNGPEKSPQKKVFENLDTESQNIVLKAEEGWFPSPDEKKQMLEALNKLLSSNDAFSDPVFQNLELNELANALQIQCEGPCSGNRIILNRLILESVFPEDIQRSPYRLKENQAFCTYNHMKTTRFADEYAQAIDFNHPIWFFSARYKVGRRDFEFLDESDLSEENATHTNNAFVASLALLTKRNYFVAFNYERQESFKAGKPVQICLPLEQTGAQKCVTVPIGAPKENDAHLLQIELRKFLIPTIGISPKLTFDIENDIQGFEVPVYFLQNTDPKSKGVNGGASIGWRSDTEVWTVRLFVGGNFGVLKP